MKTLEEKFAKCKYLVIEIFGATNTVRTRDEAIKRFKKNRRVITDIRTYKKTPTHEWIKKFMPSDWEQPLKPGFVRFKRYEPLDKTV